LATQTEPRDEISLVGPNDWGLALADTYPNVWGTWSARTIPGTLCPELARLAPRGKCRRLSMPPRGNGDFVRASADLTAGGLWSLLRDPVASGFSTAEQSSCRHAQGPTTSSQNMIRQRLEMLVLNRWAVGAPEGCQIERDQAPSWMRLRNQC